MRKDYFGSALVCLILFSLFGLGISKASHADFGIYIKILAAILVLAIFVGLTTHLSKK